ncbi:hypothetical protein NO995_01330 [Aestuariibaculum sp. M13]|uniref:hypothetical protein n=1 Tax=Aestuariibaculum sp. M13 TaxID=2967132 RepID=UPI00215A00D1|nr:hypothetical protein [Aestuariibaculum sp. M13]MCR8666311.1 hypothetical protein [Aestuariibaculum sp. M13]
MNNLHLYFALLIGFTIISCSSNSDETNSNPEKKLIQIKYQALDDSLYFYESNIVYDDNGNIIEMKNEVGQTTNTYSYNASNQMVLQEYFEYVDKTSNDLDFKEITTFSYGNDNKFSTIQETYINYIPGSTPNENTVTHNITYLTNLMIKTSDDYHQTKVEYGLSDNNLITSIKVFKNGELKSDMQFTYDDNGNCISGTGPINEGSYDSITGNIALNVLYGTEEKAPILNVFFNYNILTWGTSFGNFKELLVKQQGKNYPIEIEWYQYSNYPYKEILNNSFDSSGNIQSITLSEIPNYPNYGSMFYKWE